MFGMDSPGQVLPQIQRYAQEGRLEIAEVMSTELVSVLSKKKGRSLDEQRWLVDAARLATSVLEQRGKSKQAWAAAQTLNKQRRKLHSMLVDAKAGDELAGMDSQRAEDHVISARAAGAAGKLSAASKQAGLAEKAVPNHLGAVIAAVQVHALAKSNLRKAGKPVMRLVKRLGEVGPIIHNSSGFELQPSGQVATQVDWLLANIEHWLDPSLSLPEKPAEALRTCAEGLRAQVVAIESGEQAANARLQAQIDKLNPSVDYHTYSRGN